MSEFISDFHFLRPWVLLLLILPCFMYSYYIKGATALSSWQKVIDKNLLDYLLIKGSSGKRKFYILLAVIATFISIIALAGPSWNKIEIPTVSTKNPVMILLNMSSDMNQSDISPNRLSRAKYQIKDFLSLLKGAQVGIEVYTSEPFVISPITEDVNILINLLPAIVPDIMPVNQDRLDRAIEYGIKSIKSAGYNSGHLLVFTSDIGQKFDLALQQAQKAAAQGFIIDVIEVNSSSNSKLELLAQKGNGNYSNIQNSDAFISSLAQQISTIKGELKADSNSKIIWFDNGYYLLFVILFIFLMFFRKGLMVIAFVFISFNAQASFFLNSDQDGLKAYNLGQYRQASELFKDNNWKASSFYKAKDYNSAYQHFALDNSATGLYNQGNSLAKMGKIKEAIAKYEQVLKLTPDNQDAKFNLDYLKKQQKQNQQNQQDQNKKNNSSDKNNQQDQNQQNQQNQDSSDKDQSNQSDKSNQSNQSNSSDNNNSQNKPQNSNQPQDSLTDNNSDKKSSSADKSKTDNSIQDELSSQKQDKQTSTSKGSISKQATDDNYSEQMQAKAQQYREIKEDVGGLLKALIYSEYSKNRYNE